MSTLTKSSHLRSILKGISWRIIATTDTILVVLIITCLTDQCNIENAIKIGASEFLIKLFVYYLHERLWLKVLNKQAITPKEILYKSLSWRVVATSTTFIISGLILESFNHIAFYIAIVELFTKFGLYYLHEKLWLRLPLGKVRRLIERLKKDG